MLQTQLGIQFKSYSFCYRASIHCQFGEGHKLLGVGSKFTSSSRDPGPIMVGNTNMYTQICNDIYARLLIFIRFILTGVEIRYYTPNLYFWFPCALQFLWEWKLEIRSSFKCTFVLRHFVPIWKIIIKPQSENSSIYYALLENQNAKFWVTLKIPLPGAWAGDTGKPLCVISTLYLLSLERKCHMSICC